MAKAGRIIVWILTVFTALTASYFLMLYFERVGLDYNTEGNYLDADSGLSFSNNGVVAFGFLAVVFIAISGCCLYFILRSSYQAKKRNLHI